ncbi:hypothetical protein ACRRTK_024685 [Alexandromys fortis]
MSHLESLVLCREAQVSTLQSLFGELPHAFVNCVECFTLKLLLEQILNKLSHLSSSEADCPTEITCETFNDFVRLFKQVTSTENLKDQTVYITDRNVTVIFLSEIIWEKFRPNTGCFEPFVLYFPDYSIGNLQKILSHDHPPEYSADFYAAYINILLGVFYTVCRDLKELRHLAVLNFPKYCEPVVKGEGLSAYTHVELPYYSKFILIAAYLASYNPARTDRRFFLKTSNHLLGPKPFPLDRLLAILYSIVDSRVPPTAHVFSQITSLVTLQLLTLVGHDDQLDGPKYKCTVSLDFIRAIARTVNFDIIKYLYDFL